MLEETEKVALEVEDIVNKIPEVDLVMNSVGGNGMMSTGGSTSNTASLVIVLKPLEERDRSDQDIAHELQDAVNGIPGAEITVSAANMMSMGGSTAVSIGIKGNNSDNLEQLAPALKPL